MSLPSTGGMSGLRRQVSDSRTVYSVRLFYASGDSSDREAGESEEEASSDPEETETARESVASVSGSMERARGIEGVAEVPRERFGRSIESRPSQLANGCQSIERQNHEAKARGCDQGSEAGGRGPNQDDPLQGLNPYVTLPMPLEEEEVLSLRNRSPRWGVLSLEE